MGIDSSWYFYILTIKGSNAQENVMFYPLGKKIKFI